MVWLLRCSPVAGSITSTVSGWMRMRAAVFARAAPIPRWCIAAGAA
jgi:hypothetical protein